ncbi:hypothetical protein E2R58_17730 [Paenibacillus amylolyticus]|uniref:hypothetical protein n=1 Tax=Paenibacillus TaxID=44249 RepID=UPI00105A4413|nr:hypothetical protein [Paenibacillus amylolyticus]TDL65329.1 hypothetical protein E2R58_17730 [Paenibacillus amylolyticus]
MKRKLISIATTFTMSIMLLSSSAFANGPELGGVPNPASNHFEIPIDAGPAPVNTVAVAQDSEGKEFSLAQNDRVQLQEYIAANFKDAYAGAYTEEDGTNVILLTSESKAKSLAGNNLETVLKSKSKKTDKLKFKYVKYSENELYEGKEKIFKNAESLDLEAVGIDTTQNKVNVYITQENLDSKKDEIVSNYLNEDMINWIVGDVEIKDNAYDLFPGERIERYVDGNSWGVCSLGFNGRASGNDVGVTAGHCSNGTYYDLSDGSASIGTMSNANNSSSSSYDAGFVKYVSGVKPSVFLNGSTMTVGTTDYSGAYRQVGDYVKIHATSKGGTGTSLLKVIDSDLSIPGNPMHLVRTEYGGLIGGDSGGLVYSIANNGVKSYARVEGIYKGNYLYNGTKTGEVFSKYSYVYDGLGMSGVYTDNSY